MTSNTIEHKVNIFISSKCGGKYEIMRKALKRLLLETGLTDVYCFETEPASSTSMPSAYLHRVDWAQLLILIVDNKDGISDATMAEYKRARELGIRILAIFCTEKFKLRGKSVPPLQKATVACFVLFHKLIGKPYDFGCYPCPLSLYHNIINRIGECGKHTAQSSRYKSYSHS